MTLKQFIYNNKYIINITIVMLNKLDNKNYIPSNKIKKQFIIRQIEHIRQVQDNMILLEVNSDKLPFKVNNWELLQRGMQHDLDKFSDLLANNFCKIEEYYDNKRNNKSNDYLFIDNLHICSDIHYQTQSHHLENHIVNNNDYSNLDLCEFCCDCYASSVRYNNDPIEYCEKEIFPKNNLLSNKKTEIIIIFNLLKLLN